MAVNVKQDGADEKSSRGAQSGLWDKTEVHTNKSWLKVTSVKVDNDSDKLQR